MHPVIVQYGHLTIRWYGVMIALACLVGMWLAGKEARRNGIGNEIIQNYFLYVILGAVIGARLYFIAFNDITAFWQNPLSVFAVWEGGLAIHGAILGGLVISFVFTRYHRINLAKFLDTLTPSLILGQAIGRIGCFFNGDAHGYPTTLPWGMVFSPESPAGQMYPGQSLHPTQLYEMVLNLIIFGILWKLRKKLNVNGHLFLLYAILYSAARIFVEYFRADKLTYYGNFSAAQTMGVIGIVLGISLMFYLKKNLGSPVRSK
ncbi:MAG: prolipoprotein diacylglyceryl transferase [Desulfobacterales bacterium]|nr:MAG: prolipoprotein diacylglyceryl transferase [Desulfobacterales bacterium]